MVEHYDPDMHDALCNFRRRDGSLEEHAKYGPSVIFFAPKGSSKYWIKVSTLVLGLLIIFIIAVIYVMFII